MYKFYNANVHGNFVNDCTVRAISVAEGKTWDETYDKLSEMAQLMGTLLDDSYFIDSYLDMNYPRVNHKAITVGELAEEYPVGTFLVTMPNHISVIKNGVVYDIFDCRDKEIWGVWKVNKKV